MSGTRILWPILFAFFTGCFSLAPPLEFNETDAVSTDDNSTIQTDTDTGSDIATDTGEPQEDTTTIEDTQTETETESIRPTCADGLFCYDPPRECDDNAAVKVFEVPGYCVEDEASGPRCEYLEIDAASCTVGGCTDGLCEESPCDGILCVQPVTRECNDLGTRVWFYGGDLNDPGECVVESGAPVCQFPPASIECDGECLGDHCSNTLCGGLVCGTPPASYCKGNVLHRFSEVGDMILVGNTCECRYTEDAEACGSVCNEGRCAD